MTTLKLTDEQKAIVECESPLLVVGAFAGTGKTSTEVQYALRRPGKRFVYLAFNRSIKEEGSKKFPSNVRCVTSHGLAFPTFGVRYQHKLGMPRPNQIAEALKISPLAAGKALEILNRFLASADPALSGRHMVGTSYSQNEQGQLFDAARMLWTRMQDVADPMPMPHDGYLKLYQLSGPRINTDYILFDEYQDANPVTSAFVLAQPCSKIMVGDTHQSIYSFRGAVDSMNSTVGATHMSLTKSFRFGAGVADVATGLLQDWKGETRSITGLGKHETVFSVNVREPHAKLARTNGELFRAAVGALSDGRKFGYVGGVEGYRLDAILDTYQLYAGKRGAVRDPWIKSFEDFSAMRAYGDSMDDKEIKMLSSVVEEYKSSIPSLISEIKSRAVKTLTGKEIALATVHKAKGLEFDSVVLMDDFVELATKRDEKGRDIPPEAEEINILYVAVTRAERCLALNDKTLRWLEDSGRYGIVQGGTKGRPSNREKSVIRPAAEPPVSATAPTDTPTQDGAAGDEDPYLEGFVLGLALALQKMDRAGSLKDAAKDIAKALRDPRLAKALKRVNEGSLGDTIKKHQVIV